MYAFIGPALKTLKISLENECHSVEEVDIFINAPMLENLHLRTDGSTIYCFHSRAMESLVNVSIDFGEFVGKYKGDFCYQILSLLKIVSSAKYLSLSASSLLSTLFKEENLPAFGNLNRLELVLCDSNYAHIMRAFLKCAPLLEDIVIICERSTSYKYFPVFQWNQWNEPKELPVCLSSHLKTISISAFKGWQGEIKMVRYLLKNGLSLKKMTICTNIPYVKKDWCKELLLIQMMTACQVEFIKMQPKPSGHYKFKSWFQVD